MKTYKNMTWNDLVRKYIPDATDKECDFILWEKTSFPLTDVEDVEEQIKEFAASIK
jgi:hypothetical protein